jgi:hypothetical protein
MKYTRKTFIDVSNILNQYAEEIDKEVFSDIVNDFGDLFKNDNSNFDFIRFEEACNAN